MFNDLRKDSVTWLSLLVFMAISFGVFKLAANPFGQGVETFSDEPATFRLSKDAEHLRVTILPGQGHYLYKKRLSFSVRDSNQTLLFELPPARALTFSDGTVEDIYDVPFEVELRSEKVLADGAVIQVDYQSCRTDGLCLPPMKTSLSLNEKQALADSSFVDTPQGNDSLHASTLKENRFFALLTFFLLGLGLSLTPCVLPMLPILASIIAGDGTQSSSKRGAMLALTYVFAMAVAYALVGGLAAFAGHNLQAILQTKPVIIGFSLVFLLLALSMFGVFELELPYRVRQKLSSIQQNFAGGRFFEAFLMGILASLVVSPCITPPLAGSLLYISSTGDILLGATSLFVLGLGMGVPLVVIGAFEGALLPKAGHWMHWVKEAFGFALIFLAIWMLERVLPKPEILGLVGVTFMAIAYYLRELIKSLDGNDKALKALLKGVVMLFLVLGILEVVGAAMGQQSVYYPLKELGPQNQNTADSSLLKPRLVSTVDELNDARAEALASEKAVVLEFYADWCTNCKILDKNVFRNAQVQAELANSIWLKVDLTSSTAGKEALMRQYQVFAPPVTLVIAPDGGQARLVGLFEKAQLLALLP